MCCFEQILEATSNNCCVATYLTSHKSSMYIKQDMLSTGVEEWTKSLIWFWNGIQHMSAPELSVQSGLQLIGSLRTLDAV